MLGKQTLANVPMESGAYLFVFGEGLQPFQELFVEFVAIGCQPIETPMPIFSSDHQTGPSQIRQMPGGGWLRNAKDRHKIADTDFALSKQIQNA